MEENFLNILINSQLQQQQQPLSGPLGFRLSKLSNKIKNITTDNKI